MTALLERVAAGLDHRPDRYAQDPVGWSKAKLGVHLWSKQVEICESVRDYRRTAVKSCHGVGKSFVAGDLTTWWIDTHPPGTATVVTTAPSFPQVRAILWKEINRAHTKGHLAGRVNQTEWWIGNHQAAFGRKPSDYDQAAFQGIHDEFVLVILDEACGIPEQLWVDANALLTNEDCRILAIGNPDNPSSHFRKVCQPGSGWNTIRIAAHDSPNFTGEVVPPAVARVLVGQTYLDELAADVGIGSPIWTSKVEGEFAEDSSDGVVLGSTLAHCRLELEDLADEDLLPVELGVDVGGSEGGDSTVIRERRGVQAGRVWRKQSAESEVVAAEILARIVETGATRVKIDSIGIGWGVAGHLNAWRAEGRHDAEIVKVNVGEGSSNPARFPKLRDELWWEVGRMLSEDGVWDLSQIDDRTAADLTAPKWSPDVRGRIQVEPKKETRKRLGRSPDDADALLLAFYGGSRRKRTMRFAA